MRVTDEPLVECHLAPFKRQIEPGVGRLDARHLLAQPSIVGGGFGVGGGRSGEQRRVDLLRGVEFLDASGNHDRYEAASGHLGRDADRELRRSVGQVVSRLFGRREAERRSDERRVLAAAFANHVRLQRVVPVAILAAECGRPHRFQVGPELHVDRDRLRRGDVEQHEAARLVERHEPRGIDGEARVCVANRNSPRAGCPPLSPGSYRGLDRRRRRRRTTDGSREGA